MSVELQSKRFETNSHDVYRPGSLSPKESQVMKIGWAYLRYIAWQILSKLIMGLVVVGIVSEGARRMEPSLAQKLYKVLPIAQNIDHRIDIAHCFALGLLIGTWWSWAKLLETWLGIKPYSRATTITLPLAFVFITVDTTLFYMATAQWKWGGSLVSFTSLLATAGYVAILVYVSFVSVQLKEELKKAKS